MTNTKNNERDEKGEGEETKGLTSGTYHSLDTLEIADLVSKVKHWKKWQFDAFEIAAVCSEPENIFLLCCPCEEAQMMALEKGGSRMLSFIHCVTPKVLNFARELEDKERRQREKELESREQQD